MGTHLSSGSSDICVVFGSGSGLSRTEAIDLKEEEDMGQVIK